MSEKIMGALAAGKWVVTSRFVNKSYVEGQWKKATPFVSHDVVLYHRKLWRQLGESGGCFYNMKAIFLLPDSPSSRDVQVRDVYTRIVRAGGGQVNQEIDTLVDRVPSEVTHVIVDPQILDSSDPRYERF